MRPIPQLNGRNGKRGKVGKLSIVNRGDALPKVTPEQKVRIRELTDSTVTVSQNIWKFRQGGSQLLASGSIIDDLYQEFDRQIERSVQLVLQSPLDLDSLSKEKATVSLSNTGKVNISFPEDILVKGDLVEDGNISKFVVEQAISKKEATKLQISQVNLSKSEKRILLVDVAGKSDIVSTNFKITYKSKDPAVRFSRFNRDRYDFKTVYQGDILSETVTSDRRNFTIDISQIPIPSEYLQTKVPIKIELVAVRSLGDKSVEQKMSWQGEISAK